MKLVISPAKKLNTTRSQGGTTTPAFLDKARILAAQAKTMDPQDLADLMDLSPNLAQTTHAWFRSWTDKGGHEAGALFDGDVHTHLAYPSMPLDEKAKAQDTIRILSGLYGVLKPTDTIAPYRLEMGRKLHVHGHRSLYSFWGETIGKTLSEETDVIVNLASQEYFKAVDSLKNTQVITPIFVEDRGNGPKIVSVNAKRARGAMAAWLNTHGLEALHDFAWNGYTWQGQAPEGDIFLRRLAG